MTQLVACLLPMSIPGEPREVADAILYLASERSSFVTGAIMEVSGGQDM